MIQRRNSSSHSDGHLHTLQHAICTPCHKPVVRVKAEIMVAVSFVHRLYHACTFMNVEEVAHTMSSSMQVVQPWLPQMLPGQALKPVSCMGNKYWALKYIQRAEEKKEQTLKHLVPSHCGSWPSHSLYSVNHPCRLTKLDKRMAGAATPSC